MNIANLLDSPIEYLNGVGPAKGELLRKELRIFTFGDLMLHFPYRYIDKTQFHTISSIDPDTDAVQLKGSITSLEILGESRRKRLVAKLKDNTGTIELVWFQSINWVEKNIQLFHEYIVYGKVTFFNGKPNIAHPEIELAKESMAKPSSFAPVYASTEKLTAKGLDAKGIRKAMENLMARLNEQFIPENLPQYILDRFQFPSHYESIRKIHFPRTQMDVKMSTNRLKFQELFYMQLRLLILRKHRRDTVRGYIFDTVGSEFNDFYSNYLAFELTNAQKRVIKEIRIDLGSGIQMNRLLQGDVGSGKTIVALMSALIAIGNGFQACIMAPTEILAMQHFISFRESLGEMQIVVEYLSGSIKGKKRAEILEKLKEGSIHILIGTHALVEDPVVFHKLGLAIIDEQHRFGVEQRSKLWKKAQPFMPHVLVMTATPIPRTLAMTIYGDLDVSIIDELPPGRKHVRTEHRYESHRLRLFGFIREQIATGRQVYVVYPMIQESEKTDLMNLMEGFESLSRDFPQPEYQISIVHGKMKSADKEYEMQRFVKKETQIMVATTVIEVGVNIPNASLMIIENSERFGLSQLHQLRGRVGRGAEQSYCILMTGNAVSAEGKERLKTMTSTNNGFEIAEADLKIRGPGNIEGTQQSGVVNLHIADLAKDGEILRTARVIASKILEDDPNLHLSEHFALKEHLRIIEKISKVWNRIS